MAWLIRIHHRPPRLTGLSLLILSILYQIGCGGLHKSGTPQISTFAPNFELKDLSGETIRLTNLRGRAALIDFWATWCVPCMASIPFYEKIYEQNRSNGFIVIGINEDTEIGPVATFVGKKNMTYPILPDPRRQAFDSYGVREIPTAFLIDSEGKITSQWVGFDDGIASEIEKAVDAAIKQQRL